MTANNSVVVWLDKEVSSTNDSTLFTKKQQYDEMTIIETLQHPHCMVLRLPMMEKCIQHLRNHKYVVSALKLFIKIIELYPKYSHGVSEVLQDAIIGEFHERNLLHHFFDDVQYFKQMKINSDNTNEKYSKVCNFRLKETSIDPVIIIVTAFIRHHEMQCNTKFIPSEIIPIIIQYYTPSLNDTKQRLYFLQHICSNNHNIKLSQRNINIFWDAFIVNALTLQERNAAFVKLKNMVHAGRSLRYIYLKKGVGEMLFDKMIQYIDAKNISEAMYKCFERYFVFVNCQKWFLQMCSSNTLIVNNYHNLVGLDMLWQIIISCKNDFIHQQSALLINKFTPESETEISRIRGDILSKLMDKLANNLKNMHNNSTSERILSSLHYFLDGSECHGIGGLRPHEALHKGKKYELIVIDKSNYNGYGTPQQVIISIHENDSLWDLRVIIGKETNTYPELVKIYRELQSQCISHNRNSLSMKQLNINPMDIIVCMKKDHKSMRVPLITGAPAILVKKANDALTTIFSYFATNEDGSMSAADLRKYILTCGAGENSASQTRIQGIFTKYGTGENIYKNILKDRLSLEGFLNFYQQACVDRPDHVWNDLYVFKYRYNLRHEDEEIFPESLPRYMLATNNKYFDILTEKCLQSNDNKIKQMAWRLILRLPTNPTRKKEFIGLCHIEKVDWKKVLPRNNLFKFVYGVLICESLVIGKDVNWKNLFLKQKGFEYLGNTLLSFKSVVSHEMNEHEEIKFESAQQLACNSVLRMSKSFERDALSVKEKKLMKLLQTIDWT
eukprot:74219_1